MAAPVDLDRVTDRAWNVLERDLARRIKALERGEAIRLALDAPERGEEQGTPFVQVVWRGSELLMEAPRNRCLADQYRLSRFSRGQLQGLSWERVGNQPNYRQPVTDAKSAAFGFVWALRRIWGVPHPAFLVDTDDLIDVNEVEVEAPRESSDVSDALDAGASEDKPATRLKIVGPRPERTLLAVSTRHAEHLRELVHDTLSAHVGHTIEYDQDGDLPIRVEQSVVFVRVADADHLRIFAELVVDIDDHRMAHHEARVLNRDTPHFKFEVCGDVLRMYCDLNTDPCVPGHLRQLVDLACEVAAKHAPSVAFRVGGRSFLDGSGDA